VFRTKQYLAAIRPSERLLLLSTMYYPDEIRETKDVPVPSGTRVAPKELQIAEQLIDSLTSPWKPEKYSDTYREAVLDLVKRKSKGAEIVLEREEEPARNVVDLFEALQSSLEANKGRGRSKARKATKATKATRKRKAS
jgi:DNA end-binding protein Ku